MSSPILQRLSLQMFWPTFDPFLFCAFHNDVYPKANPDMTPNASFDGRALGQDFSGIDGWRMYHGTRIPGFPGHPHRGFETVTVVNKGLVDHADSMGAAGRYGQGDTQWMTAGEGIQHSEMFPLLNQSDINPLELFQIWLNLPGKNKMVPPHFSMFWNENTPVLSVADSKGINTQVKVVAGSYRDAVPLPCPPHSWSADPQNEVAIWLIDIPEYGEWLLPAAKNDLNRTLYFYEGEQIELATSLASVNQAFVLKSDEEVVIRNLGKRTKCLLLQGRPIGEKVEQHGPFVMNTRAELQQAFQDYQRTEFGGWPWPNKDQTHQQSAGRFAQFADGTIERPETNESSS